MLDPNARAAPSGRTGQRPISCQECTIQIGEGYQEAIPFEFVLDEDGARPKVLTVCWRCWESLNRRKRKRQPQPPEQPRTSAYR
jgi:hypothetical protein